MLIKFASALVTLSAIASVVSAKGQVAQVVDAMNFCVFLPPTDSSDRLIGTTAWMANSFCMGETPEATGAEILPEEFIRSAHYVETDTYVQVTGQMNATKANLVTNDQGGQHDNKAPLGSSCAGWSHYINLIEPALNTYCIRCCNDETSCNQGSPEKGCSQLIPGDYSGPNDFTDVISDNEPTPDLNVPTSSGDVVPGQSTPNANGNTSNGNTVSGNSEIDAIIGASGASLVQPTVLVIAIGVVASVQAFIL